VIRDSLKRYLFRGEARLSLRFNVSDYFSPPMPQFTYRARNAQGGLVEGVLDCADRAIAIHQIESDRYGRSG
jgi:hypothetical protein